MGDDILALYVGNREFHAERLAQQRKDLSVAVATSGAECFERELERFDCLIIREALPDMTGIQLLQRLQTEAPNLPRILVSKWGNETVASNAISIGISDYLTSTGQYATLASRVLHYGEQYRREQSSPAPANKGDTSRQALKSAAMDTAPAGIVITDPNMDDNPIVYANERFTDLTGYEQSTVTGENCRFLQGPATDEEPVAKMRDAIRANEPVAVELRNYRADGTQFWNEVRIRPVRNAEGAVTNYVGFQQDITDRKEREQALREEQALTQAIFGALPDAFLVFDTDRTCLRWSESVPAVTGYSEAELAQMTPPDFVANADVDQVNSTIESVLSGDSQRKVEIDIETKAGTRIPYEFALAQITRDDGEVLGIVVTGRDISRRKDRMAELQAQNEQLENFAKVVSHDIRNPLQVADGQLTLAQSECDTPYLESAQQALERMESLIGELLTLARAGNVVTDTEPVDIGEVVERCWDNVMTGTATLECHTETVVLADLNRLQQVFENLFRNAIEHGSTGRGRDNTETSLEGVTNSDQDPAGNDGGESVEGLTITVGDTERGFYVADNGSGIPTDEFDQIFESGYSTTDNGTGYGLHIIKEIVEAHGWTIEVGKSDSGGARFDINTVP